MSPSVRVNLKELTKIAASPFTKIKPILKPLKP